MACEGVAAAVLVVGLDCLSETKHVPTGLVTFMAAPVPLPLGLGFSDSLDPAQPLSQWREHSQ